jgi:hypothetical protein
MPRPDRTHGRQRSSQINSEGGTMPPTTATVRPAPLCQVRVIAPADQATTLAGQLAEHARRLFGDQITCRTTIRYARRTGYVRVYLTITRKETT